MKKKTLEELLKNKKDVPYIDQYQYIYDLVEAGKIIPFKQSARNGKSPSLPLSYHIVEEKTDYSELISELQFGISTQIATDYYMKHPEIYEEEREWVLQLSDYLDESVQQLESNQISLNERSFQIWCQEKFLQKGKGKQVLKHCGISEKRLDFYNTTEPLAYYSSSRETPQAILIIENKDTFYSMRKYLIDENSDSKHNEVRILGVPIKTIVYGAGKGILRSIKDFSFCVEPYMNCEDNQYLYFGDIDYEGIGIYENLAKLFKGEHELIPFVEGYEKMLFKSDNCEILPDTKEGQNRNISGHFETFFREATVCKLRNILENGKYIPQEILNISDFME